MCFLLIYTLGSKWRPFQKDIIYSSNVSGKRSKILEKSGKNQGIPCGEKCRYPVNLGKLRQVNNVSREIVE